MGKIVMFKDSDSNKSKVKRNIVDFITINDPPLSEILGKKIVCSVRKTNLNLVIDNGTANELKD